MRTAGSSLLVAALALPVACSGKNQSTKVALADSPSVARETAGGAPALAIANPPSIEKIHVRASIDNPADILAAAAKVYSLWQDSDQTASSSGDLLPFVQASLLQGGFGPGFLEGLDLGGRFAADVAYPQPGQAQAGPRDLELAAVLSAVDPKRVIESLPRSLGAQPMGGNVWELRQEGPPILLRAGEGSVDVGLSGRDLDRGHALLTEIPSGHRIRVHASNIPKDDLDPSVALDLPSAVSKPIAKLLRAATAVEVAMDVGTDRDLLVVGAADAPFGDLGLEPLGRPISKASALTSSLPGGAAAAIEIPWGDPALLHKQLDRLTPRDDDVPPPFDRLVGDTFAALHGVLDSIDGEVIAALYVDKKEQATLVLAAETRDDAKMRASLRRLLAAANSGFEQHIKASGSDPQMRYKVSYKPDGLVFSGAKADHFFVSLPKYLQDEMDHGGDPYFGKKQPRLEVISQVRDGRVIVTIGRGGKAMLAGIGRKFAATRADSLESDGGLALARRLDGGCHFCVALDPVELLRLVLIAARDIEKSETARAALGKLRRLDLPGQVAFAAKLEAQRGSAGVGIPEEMLFSSPEKLRGLKTIIDGLSPAAAEPPPAPEPQPAPARATKGPRPK